MKSYPETEIDVIDHLYLQRGCGTPYFCLFLMVPRLPLSLRNLMSVVANAQDHYHNGTINVHPLSDQETDPPKTVEPPY